MHGMLLVFAPLSIAVSQTGEQRSDADVLAATAPAMALWSDARLEQIHRPYLDCYSRFIEGSPGSDLKRDADVLRLLQGARARCAKYKTAAVAEASAYVAERRPTLTAAQRIDLLANYRRHSGLFALADRYRQQGRSRIFEAYLGRIGKDARRHRTPAILTAE